MSLRRKQRGILALNALKALVEIQKLTEKKRKHSFWVNPFLAKRELHNLEEHLLSDILWENGNDYKNFCRMSIDQFEVILSLVDPAIQKRNTTMRYAITSRVRLAITLRYIATGDSYRPLEFLSVVSRKTISSFVPEVLTAICEALDSEYMKMPSTEAEWKSIADDFEKYWDFPHTLGAIDGKHIRIVAPPHSGSDFYNYKGFFSIVLLAVVDAHSRFRYIDVGGNGRASDVVVYKNSTLYQGLTSGKLNIPSPKPLKGQVVATPLFFIGDDIFGLDRNLMKAYDRNRKLVTSQEVYNYRLSRARLTVEMAFGRLAARFRIFHRPIEVSVNTCDVLVKACCVLHNYLSPVTSKIITPDIEKECLLEQLPDTITLLPVQDCNNYKFSCKIRENLRSYCVTEGDVPY